jgi:hypothetical protein
MGEFMQVKIQVFALGVDRAHRVGSPVTTWKDATTVAELYGPMCDSLKQPYGKLFAIDERGNLHQYRGSAAGVSVWEPVN